MNASWKLLSRSWSSARTRLERSPKRRNRVPLPTSASAAIASIDTQSTPRSANRRSAAPRIRRRLRTASARSCTSAPTTGSSEGVVTVVLIMSSGPRSVSCYYTSRKRTPVRFERERGVVFHGSHRHAGGRDPPGDLGARHHPFVRVVLGQAHGRG